MVVTLTTAYCADVSSSESEKSWNVGLMGGAYGGGFIVAAVLFAVTGEFFNYKFPFYIAAVLSAVNTVFIYFGVRESLPPEKRSNFEWSKVSSHLSLLSLLLILDYKKFLSGESTRGFPLDLQN